MDIDDDSITHLAIYKLRPLSARWVKTQISLRWCLEGNQKSVPLRKAIYLTNSNNNSLHRRTTTSIPGNKQLFRPFYISWSRCHHDAVDIRIKQGEIRRMIGHRTNSQSQVERSWNVTPRRTFCLCSLSHTNVGIDEEQIKQMGIPSPSRILIDNAYKYEVIS